MQHNSPESTNRGSYARFIALGLLIVGLLLSALVPEATAQDGDERGERTDLSALPTDTLTAGTTEGAQPDAAPSQDAPADGEELVEASERLHWRRHGRSTRELVITEVMQNPQVTFDSLGEWFEIYNPYNRAIRLNGWVIGDMGYDEHIISSNEAIVIEAGGYLVMGNNPDPETNGGVKLDYSYGAAIKLYNSTDAVVIQHARGHVAARVEWDDGASFPDPNGESMALRNFWDDDELATNWCVSTQQYGAGDLGTPGEANVCTMPAPIVITEIMQNPNAVSDRTGEWFEVMNQGSVDVNLNGWTIHDDDDDRHVINGSVVVPAGERVVLARSADPEANGRLEPAYVYGDDVKLYNSWDELVLVDPAGLRSSRVKWNDGRSFPDPTGASMSIIDERADNEDAANWCTAGTVFGLGDMGTPGAANTCSSLSGEQGPAMTISEIMRNPDAVTDSVGEWFEVHNPNAFNVDLKGWVVRDHDSNFHIVSESVSIAPGGYAVLGRSEANPSVVHDYVYDDVILHNASDELVLVNPSGAIVDQVVWNNTEFPSAAGASMAVASLGLNNAVGESWCASTPPFGDADERDLGTPGTRNECSLIPSPSTISVSELMVNPFATHDTSGEWFELENHGPVAIDVEGFIVKDEDFNEFVVDTSLVIEPGGQAVFARVDDPALNGGFEVDYLYGSEMALINSGDELVVLDTERRVVDRIVWGPGTGFAIPAGASLQRTDVNSTGSDHSAWCESQIGMPSDDKGTPGRPTNCEPEPAEADYEPEHDHVRCSRRNLRAIVGTDGDDVLKGTDGSDVFIALGGDDVIESGGGNDLICAGPGNDVIDSGSGNDIIFAGHGNDRIMSGDGNDWVFGGSGSDAVEGGSGNDSISLGRGNDKADGGAGNDKITGNRGTDVIDGGAGSDVCAQGEELYNCER